MKSSKEMAKNNYKLKIVGHEPMSKADKKGFFIMRMFSKEKGVYSLKRWNGEGNWTLQKKRGDRFAWISVTDADANSLINGERRTVDEDTLQVEN